VQDIHGLLPAVGLDGCQKFGGRNHKMAAMAIASMAMAERKGVQFDCSIMDLTAISDSGGEQRARGTTSCTEEGQKKLIQRKKERMVGLLFWRKSGNFLDMIEDKAR
jgi:hypothetical protein